MRVGYCRRAATVPSCGIQPFSRMVFDFHETCRVDRSLLDVYDQKYQTSMLIFDTAVLWQTSKLGYFVKVSYSRRTATVPSCDIQPFSRVLFDFHEICGSYRSLLDVYVQKISDFDVNIFHCTIVTNFTTWLFVSYCRRAATVSSCGLQPFSRMTFNFNETCGRDRPL